MAISPIFIPNNIYEIFNVQFPSQDADLISPGGVNGYIGGYMNNGGSKRMQWQLTGNNGYSFTLRNLKIPTFAQFQLTGPTTGNLVGSPNQPTVQWSAVPTGVDDQYFIVSLDVNLAWTLPGRNDGTAITLQPIALPKDNKQVWKFSPVN